MRAEVRSVTSLDFAVDDISSWRPRDRTWSVGVRVMAGPDKGDGEESFDLTVASPDWLSQRLESEGVVSGRHTVFMDGFHWPTLHAYIHRRVTRCEGATWSEVANKVARLGFWEFEDDKV